jgi:general secretion pathway protein D
MQWRALLTFVCLTGLLSCSNPSQVVLPEPLPTTAAKPADGDAANADAGRADAGRAEAMPAPPRTEPRKQAAQPPPVPLPDAKGDVNLNFEQIPLTTLIQVVYTEILGRTVNIDPQVMERRDMVTFRTPARQSPRQVHESMRLLLRSYGLAAIDLGGLVRVVPDSSQTGQLPDILRGAALPETPDALRPVFQLVELQAVRNNEVASWLNTIMGGRVVVQEDPSRNAIILSGTSENVSAALEALRVLDQPVMRGRASLRITPLFVAAEELARRLNEVLAAEGYSMPPAGFSPQSGGIRYPLMILPIPASNALLVFARSDEILAHVQDWASRLDAPNERGSGKGFVSYTAQNVTASDLAETLNQILGGGTDQAGSPQQQLSVGTTALQPQTAEAGASTGSVVVDKSSNTLIFRTTPEDYSYIVGLLRTLDRPAPSALIEVTVAELALKDDSQTGVEWLLTESLGGNSVVGGTLGGLSIGSGGVTFKRFDSSNDARLVVNALASSNRATILSSPRVVARNAEEAVIQVGQEVPIITSQQSSLSGNTAPDNLGVLQAVEYRSTGVILTVKPTIHPGGRIDLKVSQEVSAAQPTLTGVDNSPTFSTRKVNTSLTLKNGATVLLGGLIANDGNNGNAGIPFLKDLPGVGQMFRTNTRKQNRTELVVLITPYIITDDNDARAVTDAFKKMLPWLEESTGASSDATETEPR